MKTKIQTEIKTEVKAETKREIKSKINIVNRSEKIAVKTGIDRIPSMMDQQRLRLRLYLHLHLHLQKLDNLRQGRYNQRREQYNWLKRLHKRTRAVT